MNQNIPDILLRFFNGIILFNKKGDLTPYERKITAIAHSIMSTARPQSFLSPLQLAVAVTLHRKYGSRRAVDICNKLGFCSLYNEAQLYEVSVMENLINNPIKLEEGTFKQHVCNNADFNRADLYGLGGFHYMGSIEIITPDKNIKPRGPIPRLKYLPTEKEIEKKANIPIEPYGEAAGAGLSEIHVKISSEQLSQNNMLSSVSRLHKVWALGKSNLKKTILICL